MTPLTFAPSAPAPTQSRVLSIPVSFLDDMAQASDINAQMRLVMSWARRLSAGARASLLLQDGGAGWRMVCSDHVPDAQITLQTQQDFPLSAQVLETRKPLVVPDMRQAKGPAAHTLAAAGLRGLYVIPVMSEQTVYGTLNVAFHQRANEDVRLTSVLLTLANCLGLQLRLHQQRVRLRAQSLTDPLTGAANRRALMIKARTIWSAWAQNKEPFSVALLDLDRFKTVNDTHGHAAGDHVLQGVVQRLCPYLPDLQHLVRMGGEEFCLLLPRTDGTCAALLAEQCRLALATSAFCTPQVPALPITGSFGVATVRPSDTMIEDVLKRADAAVYVAKAGGRNRVALDPLSGARAACSSHQKRQPLSPRKDR